MSELESGLEGIDIRSRRFSKQRPNRRLADPVLTCSTLCCRSHRDAMDGPGMGDGICKVAVFRSGSADGGGDARENVVGWLSASED